MYFTIGALRSGGTVKDNMVLVGAEIATGTNTTDVSEFNNRWLANVFKEQSLDNITFLNLHEYVHTQQSADGETVLAASIKEGACDFIAELALKTPLKSKYRTYGNQHYEQIKNRFKIQMFSTNFSNWLYNGKNRPEDADLGYFMGYEICKAYYKHANDKSKAIKDIINLNYKDENSVEQFLKNSKYYASPINKLELRKHYNQITPDIIELKLFKDGNTTVDPTLNELQIEFTQPMSTSYYSINVGSKGKNHFPLTKIKGYTNNNKTLILEIKLQPNKEYEFRITNENFKSEEGIPLRKKDYVFNFKTR